MMNARDDGVVAALELGFAAERERIEAAGIVAAKRRVVRRLRAVLDAIAVVGKRVVTLAVVLLQARKVRVRRRNELIARDALTGRNRLKPDLFGRAFLV